MVSEDHDKNTQVIALSRLSKKKSVLPSSSSCRPLRKLTIDKSDFNDNSKN